MYIKINNIISNLFLNREVVVDANKSIIIGEYKLPFLCKKNNLYVLFRFFDKTF